MSSSETSTSIPNNLELPSSGALTPTRIFGPILQENMCRTMSLNNVVRLDGQATYETWAATMLAVWRSMGL
ncbi:hypothetical protein K3495_g10826 [Podosphaera aphanis]|nr:hypothetical protein K3495_g10826 [Podosphaera aphanis]